MNPRSLVLLRHGKSDWSGDESDVDRPLTKRGRRQAPDAGRWLAQNIGSIDLAVVSPAKRARDTWDLAAAEMGSSAPCRIDERMYDAAASDLLGIVVELPESISTAVLVGHNPAMEDLVSLLTGERVPMPTSAVAVIDFRGPWSSLKSAGGVLRAAGRPPVE